jgi:uncharacterized protein
VARKTAAPEFREMTSEEAEQLLARNHVGRIAFSFRDSVDIRPIHYVYSGEWLFGRTSPGDKLITLRHNQWVAFEVDEISGPLDWVSVIVHGTFYRLENEGSEHDRRLYDKALTAIRAIAPETFTDKDPVPFRTELFGIFITSISGRESSTA